MSVRPEVSRSARWRALGLLLGALALAYAVLIHPWWTLPMLRLGDDISALRERDARVQALLAQAPEIENSLAQLQADSADAPGFLREANVQLATAALVRHLETTVREVSPGNRSCQVMNRTPLEASGGAGAPGLRQCGAWRGAVRAGKRPTAPVRGQSQHHRPAPAAPCQRRQWWGGREL